MPKNNHTSTLQSRPSSKSPTVRRTSLGSTCAELGYHRIVKHDKAYSVSTSKNGWHRERYIEGVGWTHTDSIPTSIEKLLLESLGL